MNKIDTKTDLGAEIAIRRHLSNKSNVLHIRRILCNDGFSMSVQVGDYAYCWPRENDSTWYESAEIGFPSEAEELIMPYAEDSEYPTNTVYGYVPMPIILEVIIKHGGEV